MSEFKGEPQELLFDDERYKKTQAKSVVYKYVREDEHEKVKKENEALKRENEELKMFRDNALFAFSKINERVYSRKDCAELAFKITDMHRTGELYDKECYDKKERGE